MRRKTYGLFWGGVFILAGICLLAEMQGWIASAQGWFWPGLSIWLGIWILWRIPAAQEESIVTESGRLALPLRGAQRIRLNLDSLGGRLHLGGGASRKLGLALNYGGELGADSFHINGEMVINVKLGSLLPWAAPADDLWRVSLPSDIPLNLRLIGKMSSVRCDLSNLRAEALTLRLNMGDAEILCPAAADMRGEISLDVGHLQIDLPPESGLRLHLKRGLATLHATAIEWKRKGPDIWQTADFETAQHKTDLYIDLSIGKIGVARLPLAPSEAETLYPAVDFSSAGNQTERLMEAGFGDMVSPGGAKDETH